MTAPMAFRVATCLLALDGLTALYLGGLLGLFSVLGVWLAVIAGWSRRDLDQWLARVPRLRQLVVGVAALAWVVDVAYLAETVLDGFVHLLVFLLLYRVLTHRSLHDARDVAFLSFFMLVAASSVTFGFGFLFVFVAFLILGVWSFMLHHVLSEAERAEGWVDEAPTGPAPALLGLSLIAAAGTLGVTAALFFIVPRVGQAALPLRARMGGMVSGFPDRVELGGGGQIDTDSTVVMRVHFPAGPSRPELLANLRWRGVVFDRFDGRVWKVGRPEHIKLTAVAGQFEVSRYRGGGQLVVQEVYLEPIGTDLLFVAPRAVRMGVRADSITMNDMGAVSVEAPTARLHYMVYSELEPLRRPGRRLEWTAVTDPAMQRYLQLPRLPERISALARAVGAGAADPYEAAVRLNAFLSRDFHYTVTLRRETELDPLEEFLFAHRTGHCEYFAAALAVMLRSIGIPARVVGGFQRGEWNPYGRYFMVRNRDAHSWVEAYFEGLGWLSLDPSPRAQADHAAGPSPLAFHLDALRMHWYRYVINWSAADQAETTVTLQREVSRWRQWLTSAPIWSGRAPRTLTWLGAAAGTVVGVFLMARTRPWRRRPGLGQPPTFYQRALRAVARLGVRPGAGETAREFLARVGTSLPAASGPLTRITAEYERVRFGEGRLTADDLACLRACLAALGNQPVVPTPRLFRLITHR